MTTHRPDDPQGGLLQHRQLQLAVLAILQHQSVTIKGRWRANLGGRGGGET